MVSYMATPLEADSWEIVLLPELPSLVTRIAYTLVGRGIVELLTLMVVPLNSLIQEYMPIGERLKA